MSTLAQVREQALRLWEQAGIMDREVRVSVGPLSVEQAIGNPEGTDFPIQKGKERLMEAGIAGTGTRKAGGKDDDQQLARGQAFTDQFAPHTGVLREIAALPLDSNQHRAVFVSAMNAAMRSLGRIGNTVHCRDQGPSQCAAGLVDHLRSRHGDRRITLVGFQPAMLQALHGNFPLRVLDLDPDNVGQTRHGVLVEGAAATEDALDWADLLLVTGTTLVNDSIGRFLEASGPDRPVVFYGTSIAGAAGLMGWERYCPMSS